jgi:hypothetical protein
VPISGTGRDIDRWWPLGEPPRHLAKKGSGTRFLLKLELVEVIIIWLTRVSD